jgi:radical SAM enzyme (TIGR01210 family)
MRSAPNSVDARRPYAFISEEEPDEGGRVVRVSTIFLTNRECPWKCVMCDLWKNTLRESVPAGAIGEQIDFALEQLPDAAVIKLYNSGSFFDARAIPPGDYEGIAKRLHSFDRVVVESHPALIGQRALDFRGLIRGKLEVAIGLETAHPEALERLNKGMTLDQFTKAAGFLREHDIALRVFLLVRPPFVREADAEAWLRRSIDFAFEQGATVVSLIPTRGGNGAMEALAASGEFTPPTLVELERVAAYGVALGRGRVFADLWDLERVASCAHCFAERKDRLSRMNLEQVVPAEFVCKFCGAGK